LEFLKKPSEGLIQRLYNLSGEEVNFLKKKWGV